MVVLHTLFLGHVSDDFVILGKVGRQLALEADALLRPQLAPLSVAGGHVGRAGLQPVQFMLDAIDDLLSVFCRGGGVVMGGGGGCIGGCGCRCGCCSVGSSGRRRRRSRCAGRVTMVLFRGLVGRGRAVVLPGIDVLGEQPGLVLGL